MSGRFINVWLEHGTFLHKCLDCGDLVEGLDGIQQHRCADLAKAFDEWLESVPEDERHALCLFDAFKAGRRST